MKPPSPPAPLVFTDLLILPDGRVLAHNLTATMASLLAQLNPEDALMRRRASVARRKKSAPKQRQEQNEPA